MPEDIRHARQTRQKLTAELSDMQTDLAFCSRVDDLQTVIADLNHIKKLVLYNLL